MKTATEIKEEIDKLKTMKPTVRKTSGFGDNHHDAIDGQIEALENLYDENKIFDLNDGAAEDELFSAENVRDSALEAYRWRSGEEETAPSESWKELVQ